VTAVTVESLGLAAVGLAFLAGVLSFLSPCVLPLLPVYLSYVSGVGVDRLQSSRGRVVGLSLLFVAGFTVVFVLLGAGAGGIGRLLVDFRRELTIVAGVFIAVSGLIVAGVIRLPERAVGVAPRPGGPAGAFLTGTALAIGWTPCIGYVLGAILTMAASSQSAVSGSLLLLVYSLGMGVPFVLAALAFDWMAARLAVVKRHYRAIQVASGAILVVFGVLLATGVVDRLAARLPAFVPGGL
jgi:cytochrome c-type biogenesis protein